MTSRSPRTQVLQSSGRADVVPGRSEAEKEKHQTFPFRASPRAESPSLPQSALLAVVEPREYSEMLPPPTAACLPLISGLPGEGNTNPPHARKRKKPAEDNPLDPSLEQCTSSQLPRPSGSDSARLNPWNP